MSNEPQPQDLAYRIVRLQEPYGRTNTTYCYDTPEKNDAARERDWQHDAAQIRPLIEEYHAAATARIAGLVGCLNDVRNNPDLAKSLAWQQVADDRARQALSATPPEQQGRPCFWPSGCSDSTRCKAFGGCVADAQNKAARLAREKPVDAAAAAGQLANSPQAEMDVLRLIKTDLETDLAALRSQLAEAKRDGARLDWVEANHRTVMAFAQLPVGWSCWSLDGTEHKGESARAATDAALSAPPDDTAPAKEGGG